MAKSLVIVESPAKAKTIEKFLGRNYVVKASVGHVIDLPKSKLGVDIDNNFEPQYITIRGKGPVLREIKALAKKSKKVYLATDPDREGEAISWHLARALGIGEDDLCRIEFNEITKNAIKNAIKKPRPINRNLVDAQQARRVLDRLVGYKISPLLWKNVRKGLSAGRVQSVATKLIIDREEEIKNFKPEEYWSLTLKVENDKKEKFEAKFYADDLGNKDINTEEEVNRILDVMGDDALTVTNVKKGQKRRNPSLPFTTSTLQQEASNKLGFSTRKTMSLAQQLYEGIDLKKEGTVGLITYMRTDSTRISDEATEILEQYIIDNIGEKYAKKKSSKKSGTKKKGVQDAHEAIRPTDIGKHPNIVKPSLTKDQYSLYKLIWERYAASQMSPALYDTLSVDLQVNGIIFKATGSILRFDGFLKIYSYANVSENIELPDLQKGDVVNIIEKLPKQHFTQPPPRYTEASLVKTMEELGVGRPSTYSPTISTILARGYVEREGKYLVATELGYIINEILVEYFIEIINVNFTADLEKRLDNIEEDGYDWRKLISEFYGAFYKMLANAEEHMEQVNLVEESDENCEKCGAVMLIKHGRYGKFLACPNYPDCNETKPFLHKIGVKCPQCKDGDVIERRSRKGRLFYGCSNFPQCRFISWNRPVGKNCPQCESILVCRKSKKGDRIVCSNRDCKYEEKTEG
ncbi:MAG: type I DNA topoisomerase [Candidatus Alkaliphilus sp. MAG34]|nr:type I DNA topoisomerase [Clostridiales bacterium]